AGLDLAPRLLHFLHVPYPREVRDLLRRTCAAAAPTPVRTVALLHRVLGEIFAGAVRQLAEEAKFDLRHAWCVGCSGHTLWHEIDCHFPTTLSLGLASLVAERTGVTTLSDPRGRDVV